MKAIFTICSNNYLAQATLLGQSIQRHQPDALFVIALADKRSPEIDYAAIPFEVLPVDVFEPRSAELASKYDIVEFNTCVKPAVFEYLFRERGADTAVYLDPDIRIYGPLVEVERALERAGVALTPHALTPIPRDGREPSDNTFLRFGVYNLGFVALRRGPSTFDLLRWWKDRTYEAGYIRPDMAMFVDQLYVNLFPVLFPEVAVIRHSGYNMAPWNLHERVLDRSGGAFRVNGTEPLVFFHFSSFRVDSGELPVHVYNRFSMKDRPDLVELYAAYNEDIKRAGHAHYIKVPWAYARRARPRRHPVVEAGRSACRQGVMWGLQRLPRSLTERAYKLLRDAQS